MVRKFAGRTARDLARSIAIPDERSHFVSCTDQGIEYRAADVSGGARQKDSHGGRSSIQQDG